jgi:hypothetical protein
MHHFVHQQVHNACGAAADRKRRFGLVIGEKKVSIVDNDVTRRRVDAIGNAGYACKRQLLPLCESSHRRRPKQPHVRDPRERMRCLRKGLAQANGGIIGVSSDYSERRCRKQRINVRHESARGKRLVCNHHCRAEQTVCKRSAIRFSQLPHTTGLARRD